MNDPMHANVEPRAMLSIHEGFLAFLKRAAEEGASLSDVIARTEAHVEHLRSHLPPDSAA